MDKMLVCGTSAPGSIPGESTKIKSPMRAFNFALAETVPAHSFVRNRKPERCRRQARQGREQHNFKERSAYEISRLLTELPGETLLPVFRKRNERTGGALFYDLVALLERRERRDMLLQSSCILSG